MWDDVVEAGRDLDAAVAAMAHALAVEGADIIDEAASHQEAAFALAVLGSEALALRVLLQAAETSVIEAPLVKMAAARLVGAARARLDGQFYSLGLRSPLRGPAVEAVLEAGTARGVADEVLAGSRDPGRAGLSDDLQLAAAELGRFGREVIAPHADDIHRSDRDIPEAIIDGLGKLGGFGLSIPPEYGGTGGDDQGLMPMVLATEELSRYSLAAGGSLITRPEILARALLSAGTSDQRRRWLPGIAAGSSLVAVAATEPDAGSDVAALTLRASRDGDGWALDGSKMWSTFAGRAHLLMVLARTDADPMAGHRGLSLFVVEKPSVLGREFEFRQPDGGTLKGRAIPTIGYRGMHSFELRFDRWRVPGQGLVGGETGLGRGFYLQLDAFATGRLQTAARAIGVMQAGLDLARGYAEMRAAFGHKLIEFPLTRLRLAEMSVKVAVSRLMAYAVATRMETREGQAEAAMVKMLACRFAEEVTRDAMQLFGGYGYAEEYPISRLFVDARVLSIFEGTEEVLALRVIAPSLLLAASGSTPA